MKYLKLHSLYKRLFTIKDPKTGELHFMDKGKSGNPLIMGDYSNAEFGNIIRWDVEEKIDGMNIRVILTKTLEGLSTEFKGRTDAAIMPPDMQKALEEIFMQERIAKLFPEGAPSKTILFGEGYGPKIQSGGYYSSTAGFVLFDVFIDGWWLERDSVKEIADKLGVPMPPNFGTKTESEIVRYVESQPFSAFAKVQKHIMEGVVCRPSPLLLFRNGNPIIWKLKCKDCSYVEKAA